MAESHEVIEVVVKPENSPKNEVEIDMESNSDSGMPGPICKLCLDEIPKDKQFTLEQCGCFFCLLCMETYIEFLIRDGVVLSITCPDAECVIQGKVQVHEVSVLAQRESFDKYLKLKFEQEVAIDPSRFFCPRPGCASVCHINIPPEEKPKSKKSKKKNNLVESAPRSAQVHCMKCRFDFCSVCKEEWKNEQHLCSRVQRSNEEGMWRTAAAFFQPAEPDAMIKRCPVCNILIEKDQGCAQMICKNCSHVFCWYCLKLLDNDFMLRHYDKGPCKNFLGHTRAQVFGHRMGVIGLFIAFSLLLIVASPILLLAAPLFLCCKWKECCQRALQRARQENNNSLYVGPETELEAASKQVELTAVAEEGASEQSSSDPPILQNPEASDASEGNQVVVQTAL